MKKQRWEESEKRREEERRSEKRKSQKKEDAGVRKGRKVANHSFLQWFVAPEGRKVGSLKRRVRSDLGRWEVKNCARLWREARFEVKSAKNWRVRSTFGCAVFSWQAQGSAHLVKSEQNWGFCSISKNDGRRGTFEEDLERCMSRGRRRTKDMFIRGVRRSGRWFPQTVCILEHQIFSFGKMILCDRCSTSYDLASLFRGSRTTLDRWSGKIAKRIGTRPSAQLSVFEGSLAELLRFWCCQRRKIEEVLQNSFVFDVVKFKRCGGLADLLRFWCCQAQELRKSCRIASFQTCR